MKTFLALVCALTALGMPSQARTATQLTSAIIGESISSTVDRVLADPVAITDISIAVGSEEEGSAAAHQAKAESDGASAGASVAEILRVSSVCSPTTTTSTISETTAVLAFISENAWFDVGYTYDVALAKKADSGGATSTVSKAGQGGAHAPPAIQVATGVTNPTTTPAEVIQDHIG